MSSVTFSTSVGGDGSTVTDDSNATTGLDGGGHRTRFVPALAQVVAVAANTVTKVGEAAAQVALAAAHADTAKAYTATAATAADRAAIQASAASSSASAAWVAANNAVAVATGSIPPATTSAAGLMSAADKTKLNGVATGATNYTHPASHPPSIITQDASNRFVTDTEKAAWNAKGDVTLTGTQTLTNKTLTTPLATGLRETRTAMGANAIDLATGNFFTKTISGATTFTVSNVPATGTAATFILDLTNGGSAAITWFAGVKWAGGTAPTLTASGRDVLGFFTHSGGTVWTGLVMGKDVK